MNALRNLSKSFAGSSFVQFALIALTAYGLHQSGAKPEVIIGTVVAMIANGSAPSPLLTRTPPIDGETKALKQGGP